MAAHDALKLVINETISPLLKNEGFTRKGNNFAKECSDFSATVNIQGSKWNTAEEVEFFINTGIYIEQLFGTIFMHKKPSFPLEIDSLLRI